MYWTKFLYFLFVIYVKFDRASAIKCYSQNETCVSGETCDIIDCGPDSCYSLWQNSTNSTHQNTFTKLKGCFRLGSKDECADQKLCIASSRSKDTLFFCCCGENLCNEKYTWAPVPAKLPVVPRIVEKDEAEETDYTTMIAMCVVLPLSVLVFCSICVLMRKEKISYIKKRFKLVPLLDRHRSTSTIQTPRRIELLEVLATRKFGSVRKAIDLEKMQKVAVKIMSMQEEQSWLTEREIYQLPRMDAHENILQFIAAEKRINNSNSFTELWLITAYHEKGSLQDYLKTNTITWDQLCKIAYSMANGLAYLHEEIPSETPNQYKLSVAHRDFKSSNVILKNDFTACIGDFGLALIFRPSTSCGDTHGQVGTRRYMAPEVLEGAINFSRDGFLRIDMYAFGLVLWELASRCTSVPGNDSEYMLPFEAEVGCLPSLESMQEVVVNKKVRPIIKASWRKIPAFQVLCDTIEECWDHDAEARLSASCVLERITKAQQFGFPS